MYVMQASVARIVLQSVPPEKMTTTILFVGRGVSWH
jgi:hypothetical protein